MTGTHKELDGQTFASAKARRDATILAESGIPTVVWSMKDSMTATGIGSYKERLAEFCEAKETVFYVRAQKMSQRLLACASLSKALALNGRHVRFGYLTAFARNLRMFYEDGFQDHSSDSYSFIKQERGGVLAIPDMFDDWSDEANRSDVTEYLLRNMYNEGCMIVSGQSVPSETNHDLPPALYDYLMRNVRIINVAAVEVA